FRVRPGALRRDDRARAGPAAPAFGGEARASPRGTARALHAGARARHWVGRAAARLRAELRSAVAAPALLQPSLASAAARGARLRGPEPAPPLRDPARPG